MKTSPLLLAAILCTALFSCSKSDTTTTSTAPIPVSNPITPGNISGFVKGTLTTGNTYTITADLTVKAGDTLASQPGVTVIVKNNAQINVIGVLQICGTQAQPIFFNSSTNLPGSWGGFQCDSATSVKICWTHIDNSGGPDPTGSPRKTIFINKPISLIVEDSWITNGQDDLIRAQAKATVSILRNTIIASGSTDGEAINLKGGVTGTVAYNVIYSQAGTGIKLETSSTVPIPQTNVDVNNNTLVSCGWRRGSAEPGRGISVGLNAKGNIYNNIFVNNYQGLEVFADADVTNTKYGYNLFYATANTFVDNTTPPAVTINLRSNFYPNDGVGTPKTTDIISTATTDKNPNFVSFDGTISAPNGAATTNNFKLQATSPAKGSGNSTYSTDMGAYTSDAAKTNLH
jgi:Right handed beta helix region